MKDNTLTKKDLVEQIALETNLDYKNSSETVETFLEIIKETLEKGEEVTFSGFGKWHVRSKNERRGRNPQTGEALMISARRVVTFSLSNRLRAKLEGKK